MLFAVLACDDDSVCLEVLVSWCLSRPSNVAS